MVIGQMEQHRRAGFAFHQGADRGLALLPMIKSPSQWPGTARSSTSGGRSLMETMLGIR